MFSDEGGILLSQTGPFSYAMHVDGIVMSCLVVWESESLRNSHITRVARAPAEYRAQGAQLSPGSTVDYPSGVRPVLYSRTTWNRVAFAS